MQKLILLVCAALVFVPLENAAASSEKGLKLILTFDKSEYKKSEPLTVDIKLENAGKEALLVNKRFFINSEESPEKYREICFSVVAPSGSKMKFRLPSVETGLPKSDFFLLLNANESASIENKRDLRSYFDIKDAGEYKVNAVYQNVYGDELGLNVFKGKVISDTVKIKIVE